MSSTNAKQAAASTHMAAAKKRNFHLQLCSMAIVTGSKRSVKGLECSPDFCLCEMPHPPEPPKPPKD
eukprot:1754432-Amphidinium_carterae.1